MAMSSLPFRAESMLFPLLTCSRSKNFIVSCLRKTAFDHENMLRPLCISVTLPSAKSYRRMKWSVKSMTEGSSSSDSQTSRSSDPSASGLNDGTRLVRAIRSFQTELSSKIKGLRKGLSVKIFFFLVGFYCATAFATVIGQTGDWDIISAGLAVVVVEGIGALMYRASFSFGKRVRGLITVFNYWKAGLSLGLFLDSFKYEMDNLVDSCNPFKFDIDLFPRFL